MWWVFILMYIRNSAEFTSVHCKLLKQEYHLECVIYFALIFTAFSIILLGFCLLCLRSFPTARTLLCLRSYPAVHTFLCLRSFPAARTLLCLRSFPAAHTLLCLRSFPAERNLQCKCSVQVCLFCSGKSLSARVLCERRESRIKICFGASHWAGCSRRSFGCSWWCRRPHHEQDSWVRSMEICGFMAFLSLTFKSLSCFLLGCSVLLQVEASLRYSTARPDSVCSRDCRKHPYLGANTRRQNNSAWRSKQFRPEIDTELVGRFILRHLSWYTYVE